MPTEPTSADGFSPTADGLAQTSEDTDGPARGVAGGPSRGDPEPAARSEHIRWAAVIVPSSGSEPAGAGRSRVRDTTRRATQPGTAGTVARRALESSYTLLLEHEPELLTSRDPVHIHQARVATRRLRSDLRTFRPLFEKAWANDLRDELATLASALGVVRDADVLLERLEGRLDGLPPADRVAAGPLLERARDARETARRDLAPLLQGPRFTALRTRLGAATRTPHFSTTAAEPAEVVLPTLIRRPWKRLRDKVSRIGDDPSDAALHDVRIAAKRCRYAVSAVTPVIGAPAEAFARALTRVQNRLGEHQDAVLAEAWLRGTAPALAPQAAFVAGELAVIERQAAGEASNRWRPAWKAARRSRLR